MHRPAGLLVLATVALIVAALLRTGGAEARVEAESRYTKPQVYSGALRYLRVDRGYRVTEKDPQAAYLLFEYQVPGHPDRTTRGSLEIIEAKERVRLIIQVPEMPRYHEQVLRDGLLDKLRKEYGDPPEQEQPEPPPPEDAGTD